MNDQQQQPAGKPRQVAVDENGQEPLDVEWAQKPRATGGMILGGEGSVTAGRALQRAQEFRDMRQATFKICEGGDWYIQGQEGVADPEVYLAASGTRKLRFAWRIAIEEMERIKTIEHDSEGEYYMYETRAMVTLDGLTLMEFGICTSRDRFFAKDKDGLLESEDVSIGNVMKKSKTDCERRCVTNSLGLERLLLSGLPDDQRDKVKRIGYGKGTKGGKTQTADERSTANKIWTTIVNMCAGDQKVAAELLWSVTKWQGKKGWLGSRSVEDLQKLSGKSFEITYEKCLAAWKTWKESGGQPYSMDDLKAEEALAPQQDAPPPTDDDPFKGV